LRAFSAGANELDGEIPVFFGDIQTLETINLIENNLQGQVPASLGNLAMLENLFLHSNDLSGAMPAAICALREGNLDQLTADCATGNITCPEDCCTACF